MKINEMVTYHHDLQNDDRILFLVRHAEKYIVQDFRQDIIQAITPRGREAAKLLGIDLYNHMKQISYVKSSPVARCIQTAEEIALGVKCYDGIVVMQHLEAGGVYVKNQELAESNFANSNDCIGMFSKILLGQILPGMANVELATSKLLQELCNVLHNNNGSGICVTHDCILVLFVGTILKCNFTQENWFDYLEGVAIKKTSDNYFLYWNEQCFDITSRCEQLLISSNTAQNSDNTLLKRVSFKYNL